MQEGCTVVLPTYNEEGNIGKMVSTLREMYPEFYVLVMDDNSKDRTKEIVEDISSKDDHVRFFTRDPNDRGLSASIFEGIMESRTRYFINMDSDFQHPPSALAGMYDLLFRFAGALPADFSCFLPPRLADALDSGRPSESRPSSRCSLPRCTSAERQYTLPACTHIYHKAYKIDSTFPA